MAFSPPRWRPGDLAPGFPWRRHGATAQRCPGSGRILRGTNGAGKWSKKKPREIRRNLGENLITSHNLSEHLITHKNIQELQDLGVKFGVVTWI